MALGRVGRYIYRGAIACFFGIGLLGAGPASAGRASTAPGASLVLVGSAGDTLYVVRPQSRTIRLLNRTDGQTVATQRLAADPTALALDSTRDLLYATLHGGGIAVLAGHSLRLLLTLRTPAAIGTLSPVPGYNALYLSDPLTGHILYLSYTRQGTVRLSTPYLRTGTPAMGLHIVLDGPLSKRTGGTFWAAGFTPGEAVALSVGARASGTLRADSSGTVSGALPPHVGVGRGPGSIGLYGLASGVSLVGLIHAAPPRHARARRRDAPKPPLYLAIIPGPLVTVTPPLAHGAVRVPLAASGLGALPLLLVIALLMRRRRRRATRRCARSAPPAAARRVRVT